MQLFFRLQSAFLHFGSLFGFEVKPLPFLLLQRSVYLFSLFEAVNDFLNFILCCVEERFAVRKLSLEPLKNINANAVYLWLVSICPEYPLLPSLRYFFMDTFARRYQYWHFLAITHLIDMRKLLYNPTVVEVTRIQFS